MNRRFDLDQIRIPRFEFPWPAGCSPAVERVEREMIRWALTHRLIPDEHYRSRIERTKYGWLAARCYPQADPELLQIIADYFLWFFLADDLFVDRVETVTPDTLSNLTAMIDVLDFDRLGLCPVYGESAWLDVSQRLRRRLSAEHFDRFAQGMRLWASTAGLQILNHIQRQPIAVRTYETIRRHTSGMNPCLALADAANAGAVAPDEYHSVVFHRLRLHANNVVCWSNDIQSLVVEIRQPGQFRSMVTIFAEQGGSLQEGVDRTADRVYAEIEAFTRLSQAVEAGASCEVSGFITGLKNWMRGYQDWVDSDTGRYARAFAEQDADDRGIALPRTADT
jgi:hypothetical protein